MGFAATATAMSSGYGYRLGRAVVFGSVVWVGSWASLEIGEAAVAIVTMIDVVVPIWVWECDCDLFQFGYGYVFVSIWV
nr:hypothetical protein CFP56_75243 [Quercus suber]